MTDRPAVPRYEACGILVASTPLTVDAPTQITLLFETPQQLVRAEDYNALDAERQRVEERLRVVESNRDAEYALMDEAIKQRDEALALVKELGRIQPEIQVRLEREGLLVRALVSINGQWTEYGSIDVSDIEQLRLERDEALVKLVQEQNRIVRLEETLNAVLFDIRNNGCILPTTSFRYRDILERTYDPIHPHGKGTP